MSDPAAAANPSGAAQPNIDCDYANRIGRCIGESRSPMSVLQKNQRSHVIISKEIREFCDTAALKPNGIKSSPGGARGPACGTCEGGSSRETADCLSHARGAACAPRA